MILWGEKCCVSYVSFLSPCYTQELRFRCILVMVFRLLAVVLSGCLLAAVEVMKKRSFVSRWCKNRCRIQGFAE